MIEPLVLDFEIDCEPAHAFETWTRRFAQWWPRQHSVSGDPADIVLEPRLGGRIYERTVDGGEIDWGEITEWEPPARLAYLWHIRRDRADATHVEVTFADAGDGTTRLEIVHTGWERLGAGAREWRDANEGGWTSLVPHFVDFVARQVVDPSSGFAPGPASYAAAPPAVHETHISVLVLVGDRAYKLKKPVALPFLDLTSRDARRELCHREVELNRRIAPDVYLGVADVLDGAGEPCDHLVVMRRMPEDRRLSRLVREGADVTAALDDLAALVADFHARAPRSPATTEAAGRDATRRKWDDNLATLRRGAGPILDPAAVDRVEQLAHEYLAGRGPLFEARGRAGHAVDGHGDLLADDVYLLPDGPRVLDCVEFSDRLRAVDVLDDVAFLAMDLERLGAAELGQAFLAAYARHSGEEHPASLAEHYLAYRAGVRSTVACLRAEQGVEAARDDARLLLDLARRHLEAGRVRLVLVGGLPGTGKSTLAVGLGRDTGWPVLRSDAVRKELLGLEPAVPMRAGYDEGIYAPEHTAATYRELLARARALLERGESVVLDASWTGARWRDEAAAVARETSSALVALRCDAPFEIAASRLGQRHGDASDATPDIAAAMAATMAPWDDAVPVDTTGPPAAALAAARQVVGPFGQLPGGR